VEPQVCIAELSTSEDKRSRAPGGMNVEQKINELKKGKGDRTTRIISSDDGLSSSPEEKIAQ
jgi:hypothetical protein